MPDVTKMPSNLKLEELKKDCEKARQNGTPCRYCHRAMKIDKDNYWFVCKKCPKYPFNLKYDKKRDVVEVIKTRVPIWWITCQECKSKTISIYPDRCMKHD